MHLTHLVCIFSILFSYALKDGDMISIDISVSTYSKLHLYNFTLYSCSDYFFVVCFQVYYDGVHGDLCETFLVGNVDDGGRRLVDISRKCLDSAINQCGPGVRLSTIGNTIRYAN